MTRWCLLWLWVISSAASATGAVAGRGEAGVADGVALGCQRLRLVLDARLDAAAVARDWASGVARTERPAVLELRGCRGELQGKLTLDSPLAQLDAGLLRGSPAPTVLVAVDLTAEAGTYNGPLTLPIQVIRQRLVPATARNSAGVIEPIRLASTGKAAWQRAPQRRVDDLLFVSCQPRSAGFVTTYRRYHPTKQGWQLQQRSEPGLWESDGGFPAASRFPRPRQADPAR